jgi:hypothetical protein
MLRETNAPADQEDSSYTTWRHDVEHTERQRMISEAAYYRFMRRGYAHGGDLDDWLAAEAELLSGGLELQSIAAADTSDLEVHQGSSHSSREDEAMKRVIRKHPQRDIPMVEGIDPQDAPLKE